MQLTEIFQNGILKSLHTAELYSGRMGSLLYLATRDYDRTITYAQVEYNGVNHVFVIKIKEDHDVNEHTHVFSYERFAKSCEIVRKHIYRTTK